VSIALVPEAQVGDYVIVHVGHAIGMLDPRGRAHAGAVRRDGEAAAGRGARRMKYIDEFRDGEVAPQDRRSASPPRPPGRRYSFMEFCGGHTHAIARYGVPSCCRRTCA
jgi:hypothetical protein